MKVFHYTSSWLSVFLFCGCLMIAQAQSTDPSLPTPVRSSEVSAKIGPRDLGDSRLTDQYYIFAATPGDLLITIQSNNLNGDIDVFTAVGLRPLLKFSVYAENPSAIGKSIFLRNGEDLILRVEARTPNDDEGTYRITFGGTFVPIAGGPLEENEQQVDEAAVASRSAVNKGRRVSSVGARVEEPPAPAEVAAATPSPTPEANSAETAATEKSNEPAQPPAPKTPSSRRAAGRRATSRRSSASNRRTRSTGDSTSTEQVGETPASDSKSTTATTTKKAGRRTRSTESTAVTPAEASQEEGPRLIIQTREGTLIDQSMTSVRRVTVENGLVVIVGRDGKIQRVPLADVVRMSIAP